MSELGHLASTPLREARRDELVVALRDALEALVLEGEALSTLSVDRLSVAAGISRSSFYRYFADKGELILAVAEESIRERNEAGRAIWALPPDTSRATLTAAFADFLRVCWRHRVVVSILADARSYEPVAQELLADIGRAAVELVATHIRDGQTAGHVRRDVDPELTAEWLVALNDRGVAELVPAAADEARVDELATSLTAVVWSTLYDGVRVG